MKKRELYDLLAGLESVKGLKGVKFAYARAKNKKLVLDEIQLFEESIKPSDKFLEYNKKRIELCEKYCQKDKENNPIIKNNKYCGLERNNEFEKEIELLNEESKEVINEKKGLEEEYNKMLMEEIELNFHKILLDDVPIDITGQQLELIMPIIKGDKK